MSNALSSILYTDGLQVFYGVISLVLQTLLYGIHLLLVPCAVHILLKRTSAARLRAYILFAIIIPFLLSSTYWILQFAELLIRTWVFFVEPAEQYSRNIASYSQLFNAIILVNYLVSDGVVLWRAWAICKDDYSRLLLLPAFFFVLTALTFMVNIGLRIASYFTAEGPRADSSSPVIEAINIFQVSYSIWSFLTNLTATSIIGLKAWRYRQALKAGLRDETNKHTRAEQIFSLVMESGFFYCIYGLTALVFMMIKLPWGTVGDITNPTGLQLAGMYPTVVIVLIGLKRSMDHTLQWQISATSWSVEGTIKGPVVPGHMQFSRNASLNVGTSSEEDLDIDSELEATEAQHP